MRSSQTRESKGRCGYRVNRSSPSSTKALPASVSPMSPAPTRRLKTDSTSRSSKCGPCRSPASMSRSLARSPSLPAAAIAVTTTEASTTINVRSDQFSDRPQRRSDGIGRCCDERPGARLPPPSASMRPRSPNSTDIPAATCPRRPPGAAKQNESSPERSESGYSSCACILHATGRTLKLPCAPNANHKDRQGLPLQVSGDQSPLPPSRASRSSCTNKRACRTFGG